MHTTFYNPKLGCLGIALSLVKNTVTINIAKVSDPNANNYRPSKGQKIYDWDNQCYFSLSPEECYKIDSTVAAVLNGTYVDPKVNDPKYNKTLTITHYMQNVPNKLMIQPAMQNQQPTGTISISMFGPKGNYFYPLRVDEMAIFLNFIRKGYTDLPFISAVDDARVKRTNKEKFDADNKNTNGQQSDSQQSGGFQQQAPPAQTGGFQQPPAQTGGFQQQAPPAQTGGIQHPQTGGFQQPPSNQADTSTGVINNPGPGINELPADQGSGQQKPAGGGNFVEFDF